MDADLKFTIGIVLMGSGAVAAGAVGLWLPARERFAVTLALVVGAGVGVAALAIGFEASNRTPESDATAFLVATALGLLATLASLVVLRRRVGDRGPGSPGR